MRNCADRKRDMADCTDIEWGKHDLDALGILKVDVLALGMLTAIRKCLDLVRSSMAARCRWPTFRLMACATLA